LVVDITEQQAIARWDVDKLISYRGNVFRPDSIKGFEKLPRLVGPVDSQAEVMQQFSVLSDVLRANQLQLVALALDAQGNWRAELSGDVIMEFGGGDLMEKMQRFLLVYRHSLQPRFEQVARIDLRYGSGLAVAWREVPPATAKTVERHG
jgi:cell division protein FtsQ